VGQQGRSIERTCAVSMLLADHLSDSLFAWESTDREMQQTEECTRDATPELECDHPSGKGHLSSTSRPPFPQS
jgi:hypothetical protein